MHRLSEKIMPTSLKNHCSLNKLKFSVITILNLVIK